MSDAAVRSVRAVARAIGALALSAGTATGQVQPVEHYQTRVDHLTRVRDSLEAIRTGADSAARAGRVDTIVVGTITMYTEADHSPTMTAAARRAWERLAPLLGADTVLLRRTHLYIVPARAPIRLRQGSDPRLRLF